MNINWFPGHMTKSLRMIEENLKLVDAILYILDARAPQSCINPTLDELVKGKPIIYILNKADLVEKEHVKRICNDFLCKGKNLIALNSTVSKSTAAIAGQVKTACAAKLEKSERRGIKTVLRAMVIGIPNSGKSTFINNLSGVGKAITGNKPGVTRGKQWVRIDEYFEVLDTPGTLYPKLDNQTKAKRLAYLGSINDDVLDIVQLAIWLIEDLDRQNEGYISNRYKIESGDAESRLNGIAKGRGFIVRGGVLDCEKAAVALIDDFRKGRLGKIALE